MQLVATTNADCLPDAPARPRFKDLDAPKRVHVLRKLLSIHRPLLADPGNFSTLGKLTLGRLGSWDAHELGMTKDSLCLFLIEFDVKSGARLPLRDGTTPETHGGKHLLLTPTARLLVYTWSQRYAVRPTEELFRQQEAVAVEERYRVSSPDAAELESILDCSRVRRIAEVLCTIAHANRAKLRAQEQALTLQIDEADEYMADIS